VLAAVLALLASFMWGTADFGNAVLARRASFWAVVLVGQCAAAVAMLLTVLLLHHPLPSAATLAVVALGGVLAATAGLAFYRSMTMLKMSIVAPIGAATVVVPVLWGLAMGERPHPAQLAGMLAVLAGIVVISLPGPAEPDDDLPVTLTGVLLALASAVCAGFMLVALDYGAASDPAWASAGMRCASAVWAAAWIGAVRPRLRLKPGLSPLMALGGVMLVAANWLFAEATTSGDLSVVAVLGGVGPAVTILCARLFLKERMRPLQWAAAFTVLLGVVLLTAG
jgi:drug/metabolite transporter (DMT)-like permease